MGFYVRFDDLRVVNEGTNQQIAKWQEQLQNAQSAIQDIVELDSFRGQTADAAKAYFSEIHGLLLAAVGGTLVDFMSKYLLYWDGYYEIDSDIHTRLNQDTMESAIREYKTSGENLEEIQSKLKAAVNTTSDIFYPGVPAIGGLENSHEEAMTLTRDTMDKVQPYESSVLAGDVKALESFIANTRSFIKNCMNGDRNIMLQYTTGDIIRTEGIYDLAVSMEAANQYSQIHKDALQEAIDRQEKVYAQLQAEYEAEMERLAKERADQGLSQMIMGGVAVVVGVAAIVCTAGAATPIVVTAAVTGTCTVAYGASELAEGGQHLYYGLNGDPYTSAFNPLRDTLFMGNQEAYSLWGNLNMTVASLCIPIGQATKGASGLQAVKQGAKAVAKEVIIDKTSETIAAYTAPVIADTLGIESQTGKLLINMGVQSVASGLIESTVDKIEIKRETQQIKAEAEASGKGLAGLMDEADAARYEAYFGYDDGAVPDGADSVKINGDEAAAVPSEIPVLDDKKVPLENGPYIKDGKPNGRPTLSGDEKLKFEMEVYNECIKNSEDGILRDPNTGEVIDWKPGEPREGVVDFGHKSGKSYNEMFQKYKNGEITLDELKQFQFDPQNYRLETPSANRSHEFE